mgnify:CR=1 FL=1
MPRAYGSWGFVHLAVDQRSLVDNAALGHFAVQVVALTGALANAGEHRVAVVLGGDVVDQLLDQDGLADTGAAEQADLAALGVGQMRSTTLMPVSRISVVDWLLLIAGRRGGGWPVSLRGGGGLVVHRLTQQVEHAAQALVADGGP